MNPQDPKTINDLVSQLMNNNPNSGSSNPNPNSTSIPRPPSVPPKSPSMDLNTPSLPKDYQSSVRTMQSDIETVKKIQRGEEPSTAPKPEFLAPKPAPTPVFKPVPAPAPAPAPVSKSPQVPIPPPPPQKPTVEVRPVEITPKKEEKITTSSDKKAFSVPSSSGGLLHNRLVLLGIPLIILIGAGVYWYVRNQSNQAVYSPTPTPEVTETPILSDLESKFGLASNINILGTEPDILGSIKAQLQTNLGLGQFKSYKVLKDQGQYNLDDFLALFITNPSTLTSSGTLKTTDWTLVMYGHQGQDGMTISRPFIVAKISDPAKVGELMLSWETNTVLIKDMARLFGYDHNLSKGKVSLAGDNYRGNSFRFAKVNSRDFGLSYAVIDNYLLLASSRDSFRAAADVLIGPIVPPTQGK